MDITLKVPPKTEDALRYLAKQASKDPVQFFTDSVNDIYDHMVKMADQARIEAVNSIMHDTSSEDDDKIAKLKELLA